jgi:H+/Cl- antiporter ClcA
MLGGFVVIIPAVGGLAIGLMARYGSDRIRGHGIPEAIESILINGSRVEPKLAILKPMSAAISIGSGGPFGAEGPIIMTGGAFGSLIAARRLMGMISLSDLLAGRTRTLDAQHRRERVFSLGMGSRSSV